MGSSNPDKNGLRVAEAIAKMNDCVLNTDASGRPDGALMDAWSALVGALSVPSARNDTDIPLCDGHAMPWFCERNHLKGDHDCVVCAFLGQNKSAPSDGKADG